MDANSNQKTSQVDIDQISEDIINVRDSIPKNTFEILNRILDILQQDPESIIANKEIFTQILANIDKNILQQIFQMPSKEAQNDLNNSVNNFESGDKGEKINLIIQRIQIQLFNIIMSHFYQSVIIQFLR